ncbi:MAG TPA: T9SS type A sorting domain-containing protein [Candidatus Kapabacteria bacterium]|nr:T9SS type A sorting domain-containing protein [Candidatus Kapabacteria bacterium]
MKKTLLIILLGMLFSYCIYSQNDEKPNWNKLTAKSLKPKIKNKPLVRELEFLKPRTYPFESIPEGARVKAIQQVRKMENGSKNKVQLLASQPEWKNIGPTQVGGRVKTVVHHPTLQGTVYIGAAAGGIWKTTNFGSTWTPLFDKENSLSMGALAIDPNNPDILYAGTGEASTNTDAYLGSGMYRTTDAGNSWNLIGLSKVGAFSKVYVHPLNSNVIYAGATKRENGFYKSTDAGNTWYSTYTGSVTDLTINPNNLNELFIGVSGTGIFFSSDGGENWVERNVGFPTGLGRISVQLAPSNPTTLYTLMEVNSFARIYKSSNYGVSWYLSYSGAESFFNGQGWFDNFIEVHPSNPNIVLAGGIDVFRTSNGGTSWTNTTDGYGVGNVHVDQHSANFFPQNPDIVFLGNDGGMYASNNAGVTWADVNNGLEITQFYAMAIDKSKKNMNYGGTQDNGTVGNTSNTTWGNVAGGDGFSVIVDPDNPDLIYGEYYNGSLFKINVNTGTYKSITKGIPSTDEGLWHSPLEIFENEGYLYHGRGALYVSIDKGEYWVEMAKGTANKISAIGVSQIDELVVYCGYNNGDVTITTDGGENWNKVSSNGLINRYVTSIVCSDNNPSTAFVTYSGFGTPHVYKTTNYGESWQNISDGLPDAPCNSLVIHPYKTDDNTLFVASDVGVFCTIDGGQNWFPYGKNLPRSPIVDLSFHTNQIILPQLTLRAATHGRSMLEVEVPDELIVSQEITSPAGGEIYTGGTNQRISWWGFTSPVRIEYSTDDGINWKIIAENVQGNYLLWKVPNAQTFLARVRVSSVVAESQIVVSNTFTISPIERGAILKQTGVNVIPYGIAYDGKDGIWVTSFNSKQLLKLNSENFSMEKEIIVDSNVDSLFTDITINRDNGLLYFHRMNNTGGGGGYVFVYDTNGTKIKQYTSPAGIYPIGIEFVDGNLVIGDRDGERMLKITNPETGEVLSEYKNPYQKTYGPRGLCYDGKQYLYQVCTYFPGGGSLTEAVAIKFDKDDMTNEIERMQLESNDGIINARGIEFDPRDDNFWVTDYNGNIYKIAGFNPLVSVENNFNYLGNETITADIFPNPANDYSTILFKLKNVDKNHVKISVTSVFGENIGIIFDKYIIDDTQQSLSFDTQMLSSGVYFVSFSINEKVELTKRLVIVK